VTLRVGKKSFRGSTNSKGVAKIRVPRRGTVTLRTIA